MNYRPVGAPIKCPYIKCSAGLGLAGHGRCFLNGEWDNPDCPQFEDETAYLMAGQLTDILSFYGGEVEGSWEFNHLTELRIHFPGVF